MTIVDLLNTLLKTFPECRECTKPATRAIVAKSDTWEVCDSCCMPKKMMPSRQYDLDNAKTIRRTHATIEALLLADRAKCILEERNEPKAAPVYKSFPDGNNSYTETVIGRKKR